MRIQSRKVLFKCATWQENECKGVLAAGRTGREEAALPSKLLKIMYI